MRIYYLKYCDPNSILIVNNAGAIKRLYTPFRVVSLSTVEIIDANTIFYVDEVVTTLNGELIYVINNNHYLHKHFKIIAQF